MFNLGQNNYYYSSSSTNYTDNVRNEESQTCVDNGCSTPYITSSCVTQTPARPPDFGEPVECEEQTKPGPPAVEDHANFNVTPVTNRETTRSEPNSQQNISFTEETDAPEISKVSNTNAETLSSLIKYKKTVEEARHHVTYRTSIVRLKNIPKQYGFECEILAKCEFENLSGSSFDRIAYVMLEYYEHTGVLKPGESTLITHTSPGFCLAVAVANARLAKNYKQVAVLPDDACKVKCNLLELMKVRIFRSPVEACDNCGADESPLKMAQVLAVKVANSFVLDPYEDPLSVATHLWWTVPEIFGQFDNGDSIDMIVCGCDSVGLLPAFYPIVSTTRLDTTLVAADLNGRFLRGEFSVFKDYTHQNMTANMADYWCKVNERNSYLKARELIRMEAIPASPQAGVVLHSALVAAEKSGLGRKAEAKLVMILDDSMWNCDTDYCSDQWLVDHNYQTPEDIESSLWFHLIHAWRVPMKEPVIVDRNFTTFDVYSLMKANDVDKAIIVDTTLGKSPIGLVSFESLHSSIENRNSSAMEEDTPTLIGQSPAVSFSFKSVPISETLSSVLEVLKTHVYAILVQHQWVVAPIGDPEKKEKIVGVLSIEDIVHFIVDLEQRHSAKFGANLSGGFQTAASCKGPEALDLNDLIHRDELLLLLSTGEKGKFDAGKFAAAVAPLFAQQIVMNSTLGPGPVPARARRRREDNIGSFVAETTSSQELLESTLDLVSLDVPAELEEDSFFFDEPDSSSSEFVHASAPSSVSRSSHLDTCSSSGGDNGGTGGVTQDGFPSLAGPSHTQSSSGGGSSTTDSSSMNETRRLMQLNQVNLPTRLAHDNETIDNSVTPRTEWAIVPARNWAIIPGPSSSRGDSTGVEYRLPVRLATPPMTAIKPFTPAQPDSSSVETIPDSTVSSESYSPTSEPFSPCTWQCFNREGNEEDEIGGRSEAQLNSTEHVQLEKKASFPDLIYMESSGPQLGSSSAATTTTAARGPNFLLLSSVESDIPSSSSPPSSSGSGSSESSLPADYSMGQISESIFRAMYAAEVEASRFELNPNLFTPSNTSSAPASHSSSTNVIDDNGSIVHTSGGLPPHLHNSTPLSSILSPVSQERPTTVSQNMGHPANVTNSGSAPPFVQQTNTQTARKS